MSARAEQIARRRAAVRRLHGEGKSLRAIAAELGVAKSTVQDDLRAPAAPAPLPAPPAGNERAVTHGCYSEKRLAPIRQQHSDALRRDYTWLDDRRLWLAADLLAHIDNAAAWLDDQGGVVRNDKGEPWAIAVALAKWRTEAVRLLAELEREARDRRGTGTDLEAYLAQRGDGGGQS